MKKYLKNLVVIAFFMIFGIISSNTAKAADDISVTYCSHVQDIGWQGRVAEAEISGTTGQGKRIEAFNIILNNSTGINGNINFRAHVQDIGWQDWVPSGCDVGTTGESKRLEALEITLTGDLASYYDVVYRAHIQDYGWTSWLYNGATAGTVGESKRLEAFEIKIVNKGQIVPSISTTVHVQNIAWMPTVIEGNIAGTTGQSLRMEAVTFALSDTSNGSIRYQTHVQDYGWTDWSYNGNISGTVGEGKRVEAVKIELTDNLKNLYDVYYSEHVQNYGWLGWAKNGEICGTTGMSKRVEAIKVMLVPKGMAAPGLTSEAYINMPDIFYTSHVQNIGWQSDAANGSVSGTEGLSYRVEAEKMYISDSSLSGGIIYRSHVQDYGWTDWTNDGNISGTVGESKRVEAIEVKLTGPLSDYFDVCYSAHVQNFGWLGWAKNGETSGSTGLGMRLEAYKLCLIPKGDSVPGSTVDYYVDHFPVALDQGNGTYTIKVNKLMNVVTIYDGDVPIRACICSAGNATPVGTFYTPEKYRWKSLMGGVWGQYSTRITEGYLFHSVPYYSPSIYAMNPISYNKLGITTSAGCVRLLVGDAKWIYDNCPLGTEVVIYESPDPGPLGKPSAPQLPAGQTWDPTDPEAM